MSDPPSNPVPAAAAAAAMASASADERKSPDEAKTKLGRAAVEGRARWKARKGSGRKKPDGSGVADVADDEGGEDGSAPIKEVGVLEAKAKWDGRGERVRARADLTNEEEEKVEIREETVVDTKQRWEDGRQGTGRQGKAAAKRGVVDAESGDGGAAVSEEVVVTDDLGEYMGNAEVRLIADRTPGVFAVAGPGSLEEEEQSIAYGEGLDPPVLIDGSAQSNKSTAYSVPEAEAVVVDEKDLENNIRQQILAGAATAEVVEPPEKEEGPRCGRRKKLWVGLIVAFCLVVIAATVTAVLLTRQVSTSNEASDSVTTFPTAELTQKPTEVPTPKPTQTPTPRPTSQPTYVPVQNQILDLVGEKAFVNDDTPYTQAAKWLLDEDGRKLTSDSPFIKQRYLLALFFFSTNKSDSGWEHCAPNEDPNDQECGTRKRFLSPSHECDWVGIECTGEERFVRLIQMSGNGLAGTLPSELAKLQNLTTFIVDQNQLTGTLPEELYDLKSLVDFNCKNNLFSGTMSTRIGNLLNIWDFHISNNNFIGSIPSTIGQLKKLVGFTMGGNKLNGTLPIELYNMEGLVDFDCSVNNLSGTISTLIGRLSKLEDFQIYENSFRGTIPSELAHLEHIEIIDVRWNEFTGAVSEDFCRPDQHLNFDFRADCNVIMNISLDEWCVCSCTECCDEGGCCAPEDGCFE